MRILRVHHLTLLFVRVADMLPVKHQAWDRKATLPRAPVTGIGVVTRDSEQEYYKLYERIYA